MSDDPNPRSGERPTDDTDQPREKAMTDDNDPRREQRATDQSEPRREAPHDGAEPAQADAGSALQGSVASGAAGDAEPVGEPAESGAPPKAAGAGGSTGGGTDVEQIRQHILKGALGVLVIVGLVATFQFYASATEAINVFVSKEFQPVFQAVFNLIILLAVGIGIVQVVRELG